MVHDNTSLITKKLYRENFTLADDEVVYQLFLKDLPAFVFLLFLSVIGLLGNLHVLYIFGSKFTPSNYRNAVISLAIMDILNCFISIPADMADIRYNISIRTDINCKIFEFFAHSISLTSVLLLAIIAIERHRKVCHANKTQISGRNFHTITIVVIVMSFIVSVPILIMYEAGYVGATEPSNSILICTDMKTIDEAIHHVYYALLLFILCVCLITCIVPYSRIVKLLVKRRSSVEIPVYVVELKKFQRQKSEGKIKNNDTKILSMNTLKNTNHVTNVGRSKTGNDENEKSTTKPLKEINRRSRGVHATFRTRHRVRLTKSMRKSLVLLVVTVVCYSAVITSGIILVLRNRFFKTLIFSPTVSVMFRFHFINSVSNSIVYFFLDVNYRNNFKEIYFNISKKIRSNISKFIR